MNKKQLKCKYCYRIIIKDLIKFMEKDKLPYLECPNCGCLIWKKEIEE